MRNHDSGTMKEIANGPLIRSHLCNKIRFNNSTRRSDAPTGTAETERKYYKSTSHEIKNVRKSRIIFREGIHKTNFHQCVETELPYNMQH
jgi:hypothetical protein